MMITHRARQRAWLIDRSGSLEDLHLADAPIPEPAPGEVRIEVHAVGLNPHDVRFLTAREAQSGWPRIPGIDIVGRIEAVAPDVKGWRRGTRVMCLLDPARGGGFADFVVAPALALAPVPTDVSDTDAAALPSAALAAYHAIELSLRLKPKQRLLVLGGGGAVGGYALQLAHARDLHVIATYSGHDRDYVIGLGAQEVIDWRTEDLQGLVRSLTAGLGVDGIVDVVGRTHATDMLALLRSDGAIACIAGLPSPSGRTPLHHAISLHEIAPAAAYRDGDPDRLRQLAKTGRTVLKLVANGNLRSLVTEVVTFDAIPATLKRLMAGEIRGKAVARLRI